ncbi:MAG: hypothetical protein LBI31_05160 [Zoogloeaceae bacterium]|jgi:hypothetical protein|nr:hypothetical protein [Zoogloeaceae bacterium]
MGRISKEDFRLALEIFSGDNLVDWKAPPEEFAVPPQQLAQSIFEGIFAANAFDFVVVAAPKMALSNIFNRNRLPSFCVTENLAKKQLANFVKYAMKGHRLIVSITCKFENISHIFKQSGWKILDEHAQQVVAEINEGWQEEAVSIASKFCREGLLFFHHDADPIHFLGR